MARKYILIWNYPIIIILRGKKENMLEQADNLDLKNTSTQIRKNILHMMTGSESSHIGAVLSAVEIITILYFKILNINPKKPL